MPTESICGAGILSGTTGLPFTLTGRHNRSSSGGRAGFYRLASAYTDDVVKIANWHARLNVIALVVFAVSFYLRTTSGASWVGGSYTIPVLLSVLGVILITISGWLGGEMVFVLGVGVDAVREPRGKDRARAA